MTRERHRPRQRLRAVPGHGRAHAGRHQIAVLVPRLSPRAGSTASTWRRCSSAIRDQARGSQPRREPPPMPAPCSRRRRTQAATSLKRVRRRDRRGAGAISAMGRARRSSAEATGGSPWARRAPGGVTLATPAARRDRAADGHRRLAPARGRGRARAASSSASTSARARSPSPCSTPRRASRSCRRRRSRGSRSIPRPIATRSASSPASRAATRATPPSTCAAKTWPSSCPLLEGQRVLLEPALMQLRFGDEPLRPRFDLETRRRRHDHRQDELRARTTTSAASRCCRAAGSRAGRAGTSTPRRASPAASTSASRPRPCGACCARRRSASRCASSRASSCRACPRSRSRSAPSSRISARSPTSSISSRPSACAPAARSSRRTSQLYAAYGDDEIAGARRRHHPAGDHPAARRGDEARALHPRRHRRPAGRRQQAARASASAPDETGQSFIASGDAAIRFWSEGLAELPDDWDLFVPEDLVDTQVRRKPIGVFAKVTSGMDWLNVKLSYESEGMAVDRDELRRCLAAGQEVRAPRGRLVRRLRSPTR